MKTKVCIGCDEDKPEIEFYKRRKDREATQSLCKPCFRKADAKRRGYGVALAPPIGSPTNPHPNSIFVKVTHLDRGHPLRERFFREAGRAQANSRAMEAWAKSGCVADGYEVENSA